jgi:hypothetical protein
MVLDDADAYQKSVAFKNLGHAHYDKVKEAETIHGQMMGSIGHRFHSVNSAVLFSVGSKYPTRAKRSKALTSRLRSNSQWPGVADLIEWCYQHRVMPLYLAVILSQHNFQAASVTCCSKQYHR